MRRRSLHEYLWFISAIAVTLGVAYLSVSHDPPPPYVRIDDASVAPIYISRIECIDGFELHTYAREGGEEIPPVLTTRQCASDRRP